jgi:phosphoribosyl-AMP cyclohydrolase
MFAQLEDAEPGTRIDRDELLAAVRWNADGLVPAIAQDASSGTVLMLAWMNREALEATVDDGRATYWSRSRGRLWRKGETSGHVQQVEAVRLDCDGDAVLLRVRQQGPACHTGRTDCFYVQLDRDGGTVLSAPVVDPASVYASTDDAGTGGTSS